MDGCGNAVLGCGDPPPAFNAESNSSDKISKPIRVIDVRKTLHGKRCIYFSRPLDWDFHILSHTWSESVRSLSGRIGLRMATVSDRDRDAYSRAFEEEDCSEYPCYKPLLELFELLMGDGVERIWFDALCINQYDLDEKSLEISNMGLYYSLSKGCYVLTHGVGKGYELWSSGSVSDWGSVLPRWFSRVWTFQEFLLPRRLSFIVEGIDEKFLAVVKQLITENSRIGLCSCFLKMADLDQMLMSSLDREDLKWMGGFELRDEKWKSITELVDERAKFDKWGVGPICYREPLSCCNASYNAKTDKLYGRDLVKEKAQMQNDSHQLSKKYYPQRNVNIGSSDTICNSCCSKPMIRKSETSDATKSATYFVDREAYLALMQCHSRMGEGSTEVVVRPSAGIQALRGLYCAWAKEGNWRPCHVICEVGWRDCSHEEDRVLSILGLLGLRLHQVRTGNSLEFQVMQLTKAGGSEMLIELCMVSEKGGKKVGLSWAPDFHGVNKMLEYALRPKHVDMEVERFGDDYRLHLKAKVVSGNVVPQAAQAHDPKITAEASHCLVIPLQNSSALPVQIALHLTTISSSQEFILHFNFNYVCHPALSGSFEVPVNITNAQRLDLSQVSFPVRLVLLGRDEVDNKLILLCMVKETTKPEELHKIGSIALKEAAMGELHSTLESCNMQPCVLGGFGGDLIDYVHMH